MKQRWVFAALSVLAFAAPAAAEPCSLAQAVEAACCRRTRCSPSCARPASIRSAGRCGAARTMCCARSTTTIARCASWSSARTGEILSHHAGGDRLARMPPRGAAVGPYERIGSLRARSACRRATSRPTDIGTARVRRSSTTMTTICRPASRRRVRLAERAGRMRRVRRSAPPPRTGYGDPPPVITATPPAAGCRARHRSAAAAPDLCRLRPARGRDRSAARAAAPTPDPLRGRRRAAPDRDGLLPPPPERFPQRVAPAPDKPKPAKREATAAAPKPAPVPKPKPATPATR